MHIHILGICGTFMGGIALIAKQAGHKVTGQDQNVYPPMSTELREQGIEITEGFDAAPLDLKPDLVVVGNVMRRGMPVVERMLNEKIPYVSGPQWLEEHYLNHKTVLAVSGTHGKTTTSAMLAWILSYAGLNPGFLIGGIPQNFGISARKTDTDFFVIEADEYDCAFFDKRSKFVHYHPQVLIINNLEFDHADIFDSVKDIQKQFHHLVRTVPSTGSIIVPDNYATIEEVLKMGVWSKVIRINTPEGLGYRLDKEDGSAFTLISKEGEEVKVLADFTGTYNVNNAAMAVVAAMQVGVDLKTAASALSEFKLPKRRMELRGQQGEVKVYDDFAHHPTAIALTLGGLRAKLGKQSRIVAVFEPRSNSMKMGANHDKLAAAFADADEIFIYADKNVIWDVDQLEKQCTKPLHVEHNFDKLVADIVKASPPQTTILVMSNGGFNGIHAKLLDKLASR